MTEQEVLRLFGLAASIIQAHVRGFLVRRRLNFWEYKKRSRAAAVIQATWWGDCFLSCFVCSCVNKAPIHCIHNVLATFYI